VALFDLAALGRDVSGLRGLLVAALPDAVLLAAWADEGDTWELGDLALGVCELLTTARRALESLDTPSGTLQLTLESNELQLVTRQLAGDVVAVFVFDSDVQLGLARVHVDQIADALRDGLPMPTG
jgi:predicted regulator of Ras-like GTPase activity (Roadblock/LC7/MglB family)